MQILKSWKQSLATLGPEPAKLMLLVTIKSWFSCLKELTLYWWWFFVLAASFAGVYLYSPLFSAPLMLKKVYLIGIYGLIIVPFIYFIVVLCTRPSVQRKTYSYYLSYTAHYFFVFLAPLIIRMIILSLWGFMAANLYNSVLTFSTFYTMTIFAVLMDLFMPLFFLFAIDRRQKFFDMVSSIYYAAKMIVYNFPLFFVISLVFGFIHHIGKKILIYLLSFAINPGFSIFAGYNFLWIVFYVCLYTNIYIKRLHEQPEIYFKAPVEE